MKCRSSRIFCLSLLVLVCLSLPLYSEWCFSDEDYQALQDNQAEVKQQVALQLTRIEQLEMHLETAESWRVTSNKAIELSRDLYAEEIASLRKQGTVQTVAGVSIGIVVGIISMMFIGGMK